MKNCSPSNVEVLKMRKAFLSIDLEIRIEDSAQDRLWLAHDIREKIVQSGITVERTALQRAFDVMQVGLSVTPRMSPSALCQAWEQNVTTNTKAEKMSEGYVDAVYTVFTRLLNNAETKNLLLDADANDTNNLNSIYKLEAIVKRASSPAGIHWCVSYCLDYDQKLAVNALTGKGMPGGKGFLDVSMCKNELALSLLAWRKGLTTPLSNELSMRLHKWSAGMQDFRKDLKEGNNAWFGALPVFDQLFVQIWEDWIGHSEQDPLIKTHKISGAATAELLTKSPLKERLAAVEEQTDKNTMMTPDTSKKAAAQVQQAMDGVSPVKAEWIKKVTAKDADGTLEKWTDYAKNLAKRYVTFAVDPKDPQRIADVISNSDCPFSSMRGSDGEWYILVIYEAKKCGEPSARPHVRTCPFRDEHCLRMIKGTILGLSNPDSPPGAAIPPGVAFIYLDGHTHGNEHKFTRCFTDTKGKTLPKEKKLLFVQTAASKTAAEKERLQGVGSLETIEFMHVITQTTFSVPGKKRLHGSSDSTNLADFIGPFNRQDRDGPETMRVKHSEKRALLADAFVLAGAAVAGDAGTPGPGQHDMVPMSWHGIEAKFYHEIQHSYNGLGWISLTCMDTTIPLAAVRAKVPALCFCYSKEHMQRLEDHLAECIFKAFSSEGDILFEPGMVKDGGGKLTALTTPQGTHPKPAKGGRARPSSSTGGGGEGGNEQQKSKRAKLLEKLASMDDGAGDDEQAEEGEEES